MNMRIPIMLSVAAAMLLITGCDRPDEPRSEHQTMKLDQPKVTAPAPTAQYEVAWRQLTGTTRIYVQRPNVREQQYAGMVLDAQSLRELPIVASRVEVTGMADSNGVSYINQFQDWSTDSSSRYRMAETYGLPQMAMYGAGRTWTGQVKVAISGINRLPLDVAKLTGELRLLEASQTKTSDINVNDTDWQPGDRGH